ncbi:MAG: shikimate kinase [Tannerella sp.]|jgi:shikimate kinase|nr:shikimate kinase [Tannerella sp.]
MRIFLIGYMGAGKTTLGKSLACRMNLSYVDTDHFIENRYRKEVSDIFASEGEERFRDIEHRILLEVSEFENVVVSTGGGLPCFSDNMAIMNETGITVYLDVSVEELAARLEMSKNVRPVLKNRSGSDLIDFIRKNLDMRRPFYEQAKVRFNVEQMYTDDIETLTEKLEALIT